MSRRTVPGARERGQGDGGNVGEIPVLAGFELLAHAVEVGADSLEGLPIRALDEAFLLQPAEDGRGFPVVAFGGDQIFTAKRGGRDVSRQLAHMHMVRVSWMENAKAKDIAECLPHFDSKDHPSRAALKNAFRASGEAIAGYLEDLGTGRRVSAAHKRGVGMFFSYLIAHEAHHRGSILLTLKQSGYKLDESLRWGIWAWDKI